MGSFTAFVLAIALLVLIIFVMLAAQKGWRWLWLSWLVLALVVAGWLVAFNFASDIEAQYSENGVTDTLTSWAELPGVGRLSRLLESESSTGKVRVLIWEGALDLIAPHEPIAYPDGENDSFNVLRPLLGYGPESMYVAYNRFYPPELATVEARNASPDRSHNETFDALVITGWGGFLIWQVLYLSVFYYGFSWLGVVHSRRDSYLLIGLWIVGAIAGAIALVPLMGTEFLGVAIPFGSIIGLVLYLIYYALFARTSPDEIASNDPFQVDRLLMIGLVTAILAHYVEIHFGIAIAATRIHFFIYLALMFMLGYRLPQLQEQTNEETSRPRSRRRQTIESQDSKWPSILVHVFIVGLILGILGYEFMTYSLPPDKVIESVNDLTSTEIFLQSLLVNPSKDFADSPFIYVMIVLTWGLGILVSVSEMVKSGALRLPTIADDAVPTRRRQLVLGGFVLMAFISLALRFLPATPGAEVISATTLLGQSLLFLWALLCLWVGIRLGSQLFGSRAESSRDDNSNGQSSARMLAGAVALVGLLMAFPVLIAGGGWFAFLTAVICAILLYLLWDADLQEIILPVGVLGFVSLAIGLLYAYVQASLLRSTILFQPNTQVSSIVELRVLEAMQSTSFLTVFYVFVFAMMFFAAFALSGGGSSRGRKSNMGTAAGYTTLVVALIAAFYLVGRTNLNVIHADIVYKRAKPFDAQASSSRSPEDWDIAIAIYEKAIELVPNEDFYDLFLGRAYLERSTISEDPAEQIDLLEDAETRLLRAQNVNPLNTDHTANLARLNTRWLQLVANEAEQQERLDLAEGYYKDALALSPQNSIIRNEYARLAYDLKRDCDQALQLYDDSVEIDPYYEVSFFGRAEVYIACANEQPEDVQDDYYATAVASLQDGLALAPNNTRAWLQLAQLQQQLENYEDSLVTLEEVRNRNTSGEIPAWNIDYLAALSYRGLDQTDQAIESAQQALLSAPQNATPQIQQLLSELTGEPITEFEPSVPVQEERPLTTIPPEARNGIYNQPPPFVIDTNNAYEAVITTDKGVIRATLFDDEAPITVNNFVYLAQQGFYDGITFHRVLENFMAQTGDPTGTGTGGPGYQFQDETDNGLTFDRPGLLAMANAGPNTNGSQFFITYEPTPWLDGGHTIFGELIIGQEVLDSLTRRDPDANPDVLGDTIQRIDIIEITR